MIASQRKGDFFNETVPDDLRPLIEICQSPDTAYSFFYYDTIASTNDAAKSGDYPSGTVIVAGAQTNGRGRRARDWFSPPGGNIAMSIVLKPADDVPARALPLMNTAVSLAVSRAIRAETNLEAWPKWPNDVYIGAKKAGGILCEAVISGEKCRSLVIGIGINVNTKGFPSELADKATSLWLESGARYGRGQLITSILEELNQCLTLPPERVIRQWTAMSKTIGSYVSISGQCGRAVSLNEDGSLCIALESGETAAVSSVEGLNADCH